MKDGIHPEYNLTTIACVCGEVIHTRSTKEHMKVGICSKCHPFYTGKSKFIDAAGRVDRFKKKYGEDYMKEKPKVVKPAPAPVVKKEKKPKPEKKASPAAAAVKPAAAAAPAEVVKPAEAPKAEAPQTEAKPEN